MGPFNRWMRCEDSEEPHRNALNKGQGPTFQVPISSDWLPLVTEYEHC